tara:strand:+ start:1050 stop:1172 length:123 start_codon:yes stop_codon:yes gene_type:complete
MQVQQISGSENAQLLHTLTTSKAYFGNAEINLDHDDGTNP